MPVARTMGGCTLAARREAWQEDPQQGGIGSPVAGGGLGRVEDRTGVVEPVAEPVKPAPEADRGPVPQQVSPGQPSPGRLEEGSLSALVSGFAFLIQTVRDVNQSASYLLPVDPNLFLTIGLAAAAIISLLWLSRPNTLINRTVLLVIFGVAAICAFLQAPNMDTDVSKHIYLLVSLILLIQGVLIAAQTERVRNRR
jgi:hypothetical protein